MHLKRNVICGILLMMQTLYFPETSICTLKKICKIVFFQECCDSKWASSILFFESFTSIGDANSLLVREIFLVAKNVVENQLQSLLVSLQNKLNETSSSKWMKQQMVEWFKQDLFSLTQQTIST